MQTSILTDRDLADITFAEAEAAEDAVAAGTATEAQRRLVAQARRTPTASNLARAFEVAIQRRLRDPLFATELQRRRQARGAQHRTGQHRRAPGARAARTRGSRRTPSRSAGDSGDDDGDGESDPALGRVPCKDCGEPKCRPGREATCAACRKRQQRRRDADVEAANLARAEQVRERSAAEERREWQQLGDPRRNGRLSRPRLIDDRDVDAEVLAVWAEETTGRRFHGRRVMAGAAL